MTAKVSREAAAARISAYIYGNILIFAGMLTLREADVHRGRAAGIELGVALSTLLAHAFAEVVGRSVRSGTPATRSDVLHVVRDSAPIVTSALVPCLLLAAGALDWLSPPTVIITAEIYLFVRLALIGLVADRLRGHRRSPRTLLAGVVIALVAAGIAALKVATGH